VSSPLLGRYLAAVYGDPEDDGGPAPAPGDRWFLPLERTLYRLMRVDDRAEQRWDGYALALLAFSLISVLGLYGMQRLQDVLPLNPNGVPGVEPSQAWNTATSFVTNTNWQGYGGEYPNGVSHLIQMAGLAVQNFVSAAVGAAVAVALIRGITRRRGRTLGNFWVDLIRTSTRVLLPLSLVLAVLFVGRGVIQSFDGFREVTTVEGATQLVPGGPVGSQVAIKQLGTNGGGFFNANATHPFENPDGVTNLLSMWAMLAIPFAFPFAYGRMVKDRRQGHVLLAVMAGLWIVTALLAGFAETAGNPKLQALGVDQSVSAVQPGGTMEGKEARFGPGSCGVWAASTTGTSTGAVNCMHDSMTPIGGGIAMLGMFLGEVSPGGVGVGMAGILVNALLAVFIAGLMVGRTPEYLGKKVQAAEMKLVTLYILAMPTTVLVLAGISITLDTVLDTSLLNSGAHGLSELLYAFASAGNNNGSAFAGLTANTTWLNSALGAAVLVGRFLLIIPVLAIGGSLVRKQPVPVTAGTFPTASPLFGGLLTGVVLIVAGLTFFPALALGPLVEQLSL
jgi:K+-transporting ATPase ATPase A chain